MNVIEYVPYFFLSSGEFRYVLANHNGMKAKIEIKPKEGDK